MSPIARIIKSRNKWKKRSLERRKEAESKARQAAKWKERYYKAEDKLATANIKIKNIESKFSKIPVPIVQVNVRVVCVFLFFLGVISCRAIPRVLNFLHKIQQLPFNRIPHWSSVANWVCRAGLGLFQSVEPWENRRWIAIIDTSISYSTKKVLVVLRLPLDHFLKNSHAPGLSDVECIGLELGDTWNHETVKNALEKVFVKSGNPAAILKDGGSDLAKGVRMWAHTNSYCAEVRDVGHVVANELKRTYAKNKIFQGFIALVNQGRARLCQTDCAFLRPPKIRSKGRFQNISNIVQWGKNVLSILRVKGKQKKGSVIEKLRLAIPKFSKYKSFIFLFSQECDKSQEFMKELKNNGLNQESYKKAKKTLQELPRRSLLRKNLQLWLDKHMRIQCQLKMGQTPLCVSSDCIETLMGSIKNVIERNPLPEFGKMILSAPLFCGRHTQLDIQNAIHKTSHAALQQWQEEHTKNSMRKKKRNFFASLPTRDQVPDPPIARAA